MFDIGFMELLVIALVGLFVIGPERLPTTIKTVALWIGRIKRSLTETRREIEQQLGADEIRRELHNEQVMREWEKMKDMRKELEDQLNNWDHAPLQNETAPSPGPPPHPIEPTPPTHAAPRADTPAHPPAIETPEPASTSEPALNPEPASPSPQSDESRK